MNALEEIVENYWEIFMILGSWFAVYVVFGHFFSKIWGILGYKYVLGDPESISELPIAFVLLNVEGYTWVTPNFKQQNLSRPASHNI